MHGDVHRSFAGLERDVDLAEVVVRVRVVEREADESLDDPAEPTLVLGGDTDGGCKRGDQCKHQ
jgi:hypothetical protein